MLPVPTSIKETMALGDVAVLIASSRNGVLPVTDEDGHYIGIVTARVVAEALADGRHDQSPASLVLESAATVKADARLDKVIESLDLSGTAAIPVLDENGDGVIGWVDYARTLRALRGGQRPARTYDELRRARRSRPSSSRSIRCAAGCLPSPGIVCMVPAIG